MFPRLAKNDAGYGRLSNAVVCREFVLRCIPARPRATNLSHIVGGQLVVPAKLSTGILRVWLAKPAGVRMNDVLRRCHPLKVLGAIVRGVAILVVDLVSGAWRRPVERFAHQTVNTNLSSTNSTKRDLAVPALPSTCPRPGENVSDSRPLSRTAPSYSPQVRNLVARITDNLSPSFHAYNLIGDTTF